MGPYTKVYEQDNHCINWLVFIVFTRGTRLMNYCRSFGEMNKTEEVLGVHHVRLQQLVNQ